ncbi:MAG: hypothetical protein E6J90_17015 [Deltaproteobacteria bacterium]|nr:MAG: hypothetical protein E6J90_17015 [Deltaproteobacteria bacterium]
MKLRGRFTLALALAALVPIAVATFVTVRGIAASYHSNYERRRASAEANVNDEIRRLLRQVDDVDRALASRENPFVGSLLLDLAKQSGKGLTYEIKSLCEQQGGPAMQLSSLDVLTITDATDRILCAPHAHGFGESHHPEIRERAGTRAPGRSRSRCWSPRPAGSPRTARTRSRSPPAAGCRPIC